MEQKNFILAFLLSAIFLVVWSIFVVPRFSPPAPLPTPPAQTSTAVTDVSSQPAELEPAHAQQSNVPAPESILRDEQNEVVVSPEGGAIRDWRLKTKGHEIDLVLNPDADVLPLATPADGPFEVSQRDHQVSMTALLSNGLRLTKTLTLSQKGHLHDLTLRFDNLSYKPVELKNWEIGWGPGLGTSESEHKDNPRMTRALTMGKLKAHYMKEGEYPDIGTWAGIDNRYFLVVFFPPPDIHPIFDVKGTKLDTRVALRHTLQVPAHGQVTLNYQMYVGPKGYTQLQKYGKQLEEAVDFGTFSPLGKIILSAIYWLQGLTGNYGWAIVILTIALQLLMMPLTLKSFKAQLAMKKLQPQIAALQAQYKNDPKRLNIEMMNIYKKTGTNPFGGCLPMLLQLPIFWALFTTLRNAYELRGAPFVGWIHDLSAADPYHILPIVMGAAMFGQQRMSGAVTDPTQKQMMVMMPVMFTVMFFNFPAGLVLYWLTNNLLTTAFQWGFQRYRAETPRVIDAKIVK